MFFTKRQCNIVLNITISGQNISIALQFKHLGIIIDSTLNFKAHIEELCHWVRFSLPNFKYIGNTLSTYSAKLYMDAMIRSHLTYCLTAWRHTRTHR